MFNVKNVKLGKAPARHDIRTLKMAKYIQPGLATPPTSCDLSERISDLGMMKNDELGDCVIASGGHTLQAWTAEAGKQIIIPDSAIVAAYSAVTGYDPSQTDANGNNPTDQGTVLIDFLNYWRQQGIGGHRIGAYASFNPANALQFQQAIYYFGAAFIGVMLPDSWQNAKVWDGVPSHDPKTSPGSWGGHGITAVRYRPDWMSVITWGDYMDFSFKSAACYCDEAYALISVDQLDGTGNTPEGINWAGLSTDLAMVTT